MLSFRQCCSLWHGLVFPFSAKVWKLKIENWKLESIFNFFFSAKTFKIVDRTTQGGGRGVHSHDNFLLLAPSPQIPFPPCEFFYPCPPPFPPTLHFPGKEEARNLYLPRSHFSNMNDFGIEYIKDLVITQRKHTPRWAYCQKKDFPTRKALVRGQLGGLFLRMG